MTAVGQRIKLILDGFSAQFLGDAHDHKVESSNGSAFTVKHVFSSEHAKLRYLRWLFACLCIVGMVTWLALDMHLEKMDGLVPGISDQRLVQAKEPTDDTIWAAMHPNNASVTTCSCSYNNSGAGVNVWGPPIVQFGINPGFNKTFQRPYMCPNDLLAHPQALCSTTGTRLLHPVAEAASYKAQVYLCIRVSLILVQPPMTAVMWSEGSWKAAMLAEARSKCSIRIEHNCIAFDWCMLLVAYWLHPI